MYQIINHVPPALRELRRDLPEAIDAIVLRALQKDPGARYGSWYEFGEDLARLAKIFEPPRDTLSEARRFQALRALSFFDGFSDVEIWETLRIARWRSLAEGTTIIAEGEPNESFYLLIEGEVDVSRTGRQLATLGLGDCFGEMLYFSSDRTPRATTVQARAPVLVAELSAAALSTASDRCQVQFNKTFIKILINRLTAANKRLAER
jgi:hypothetical protein